MWIQRRLACDVEHTIKCTRNSNYSNPRIIPQINIYLRVWMLGGRGGEGVRVDGDLEKGFGRGRDLHSFD